MPQGLAKLALVPALSPAGGVSRQHRMTMDWTATVLDAAGIGTDPAYPLDGVSLLPVLQGRTESFDRPMHWRMNRPANEEADSLLELSAGGKRPLNPSSGETRTFLEDGDTVSRVM